MYSGVTARFPAIPVRRPGPSSPARWLGLLLALGAASGTLAAGGNAGGDEAARLDALRAHIKAVESSLRSAHDESDALMKELQDTEKAIGTAGTRLADINAEIALKTADLGRIRLEAESQRDSLAEQRTRLATQIRAGYETGRYDFLKLLLNQEDPALMGRMLAYHDYFSRARARHIATVKVSLTRLDDMQTAIGQRTEELAQLRAREQQNLDELQAHKDSRRAVLAKLQDFIASGNRELGVLQRNEQELAALVERLRAEQATGNILANAAPFASLKGKLAWPVAGEISSHFGDPRLGGRLHYQGVIIGADSGTEVHAISAGRVIFADWFRNMGLLIIIDHGDGFMTLYGHNESLAKKTGDLVRPGEVIAHVGDTGGQSRPGLYFEIRRSGEPQDPGLWCHS